MSAMEISDKDSSHTYPSKTSGSSYHFLSDQELKYMSLIQNQLQPYFPRFAAGLADQSPLERDEGRCAAIDFADPEGHRITSFETAAELNQYLRDAATTSCHKASGGIPRRRLFILEDLPCNHILALGSQFCIPPSFFAGHWDDPASSTFNHRNPFERSSLPHFRLRYATSNRVEVDAPTGNNTNFLNIFQFNTKAGRYLHTYNRNGLLYDEARSHHALSFWSSPVGEDGSWDAVLLVDPPPREFVRCMATKALLPLRTMSAEELSMPKYFLNPQIEVHQALPHDASHWASTCSSPTYTSMFDDTLSSLRSPNSNIIATHDPITVVEIPRRIVISTVIAYMRRRYLNLVSIQNSKFSPSTMRHNYLASFSTSNYSAWSGALFDFIISSRAAIKEFAREMEDNAVALGVDDLNSSAPLWERHGWRSIRELTGVVDDTVNAIGTGYLQYVTIQEARVSNENAQSLSKITVLTMLFIPLSTVASIFSMGGDFLPGQARAWVFWAAAVPLLAILAYLYWYQEILRVWHGRKQQLLPMFATKGGKS